MKDKRQEWVAAHRFISVFSSRDIRAICGLTLLAFAAADRRADRSG